MYSEAREVIATSPGGTLRERWLRLLFDMYGITPASPNQLDASALPDSPMVRVAHPCPRRRASLHRRPPVVLPFRSAKADITARRRGKESPGVEQADGDPSPETPTEELPPPPSPDVPAKTPQELPGSGAGGTQADRAKDASPAEGDPDIPAGGDLH